jgi:hypothetical protein
MVMSPTPANRHRESGVLRRDVSDHIEFSSTTGHLRAEDVTDTVG